MGIDVVMADAEDPVEVHLMLRQIVDVKGDYRDGPRGETETRKLSRRSGVQLT